MGFLAPAPLGDGVQGHNVVDLKPILRSKTGIGETQYIVAFDIILGPLRILEFKLLNAGHLVKPAKRFMGGDKMPPRSILLKKRPRLGSGGRMVQTRKGQGEITLPGLLDIRLPGLPIEPNASLYAKKDNFCSRDHGAPPL